MAEVSATNSSNTATGCIPAIDEKLFELGCLGPALAIILILASLNRRKQFKLEYCNGYPGLLIPVNFLGSFSRHNRFSIAATFGATASTCLTLFLGAFFSQTDHTSFIASANSPVKKVFQALIFTLVYGIVFYPFFACLTTDYKFVGSVLGFLYAVIRFFLKVVIDFQCHTSYKGAAKTLLVVRKLGAIPTYLCLLFIVIRFAVLVYLEVRRKWFPSASDIYRAKQASQTSLVGDSGVKHVKHLFNPGLNLSAAEIRWFMKPIFFLYKPRTDFKFSTQLISTLVVAVMIIFQCFVAFLVVVSDADKKESMRLCSGHVLYCVYVVLYASVQAAFTFSTVISILMLLHFMKCHRDHVLQLYRGQRKFFEGVSASPPKLVGKSLLFSGFQIAYALAVYARQLRLPRLSQKAVNRWHVAGMLLRNPCLIQYRKQTGVTPSVNLGSINTDISALV